MRGGERVGFTVRARTPDAGAPEWCELARDDLAVQFVSGDRPWLEPPAFTGSLYVHPHRVQAVLDDLDPTIHTEWGVEVRPWGARELVLRDPDGYFLTFTEPAAGVAILAAPPMDLPNSVADLRLELDELRGRRDPNGDAG